MIHTLLHFYWKWLSKKLNNRNIVIIRWSHYYLVPHLPQTQKDFRGAFLPILSLFLTTISLILTIWILTNWLLRLRLKSNRKNSSNHCLESVPYQDHVKQEYSRIKKTIVHITGWLNKFWNTFGYWFPNNFAITFISIRVFKVFTDS